MIYGYVYKTTNLINGYIYIGQNKGVFKPSYLGSGLLIKRAIKKYGKNNFSLQMISCAETKPELDVLEKFYISKYRESSEVYNIAPGGQGGDWGQCGKGIFNKNLGSKRSVETNTKISIAAIGRTSSRKGIVMSDITKQRISESKRGQKPWNTGKKHSAETRRKISEKAKLRIGPLNPFFGKKHSEETKQLMRKIR